MLGIVQIKFLCVPQIRLLNIVGEVIDREEIFLEFFVRLVQKNGLMVFPTESGLGIDHKLMGFLLGEENLRLVHVFPVESCV